MFLLGLASTSIVLPATSMPMPIRMAMSMRTVLTGTAMSMMMVERLATPSSCCLLPDFSVTMAIRYCNNFIVKSENKDCPCSICLIIYVYKICVVNDNLC